MNQPIELSLEQEFSLRTFADVVQQMSGEQAQEFLLMLYKQMMIREKTYQELLKQECQRSLDALSG
ncbi:NblA/ycf18 family protein [Nostoc sp. CHAB 5784]|uniref:NblA/ycf18 family protein n=1 Tax=Nostoc mirabile TaxID=2907820 RepID=UPI001E4A2FCB|nr:NblA/ycf18 family protein [Nostoc mirabile]MCC5669587.1 NblA/ycf18 family protein [Nostoc mirabile CHAB5784]